MICIKFLKLLHENGGGKILYPLLSFLNRFSCFLSFFVTDYPVDGLICSYSAALFLVSKMKNGLI